MVLAFFLPDASDAVSLVEGAIFLEDPDYEQIRIQIELLFLLHILHSQ